MSDLETRPGAAVDAKVAGVDPSGLAVGARRIRRRRRTAGALVGVVAAIATIALPVSILTSGGNESVAPTATIPDGWRQVDLGQGALAAVPPDWQDVTSMPWCHDGLGDETVPRVVTATVVPTVYIACDPRTSVGIAAWSVGAGTAFRSYTADGSTRASGEVWQYHYTCPANAYCTDPEYPAGAWITSVATERTILTIVSMSQELTVQIRDTVVLPD